MSEEAGVAQRTTSETSVTGYRREPAESRPPLDYPGYGSTRLRAPTRPPILLPHSLSEITGPVYGHGRRRRARPRPDPPARRRAARRAHRRRAGACSTATGGRCATRCVEIWQANAAGRYIHAADQHPAPLDPNFTGAGRCLTDDEGRYRFITIKPGAYPWGNHDNAWRPAHIHFSLFGPAFATRLVTQMYFPGDPLFAHDPIFNSVRDPRARERMVSAFDLDSHRARVGARLPLRHRAARARGRRPSRT